MLTYAELIQASKLSSHEHSTYRKAELAVAHAVTALSADPNNVSRMNPPPPLLPH
jgi:hypothetical protein